MLELRLLGTPNILLDGTPVNSISWVKSQALLYYLALSRHPQSRLTLAGLLWPEKGDDDARTTLRQALRTITKALPTALDSEHDQLALKRTPEVQIDVLAFESETYRGLAGDVAALRRAADLYVGEFLSGFFVEDASDFEEWMLVTRERLHTLALQVLHQLSVHCVQRREVGPGLIYTQRLLTLEPWREETHQQLMRLLAWDGQFSAALAQYDRCEQLLEKELDVPPAPATEALRQRIERIRRMQRPTLPADSSALLGRTEELATLSQWLQTGDRLVTILGAGGMGKTRLALAVARRLSSIFLEGIFWVDLTSATTVDELIALLCAALQLPALGKISSRQQLFDFLREKELLLVLDNFEQLLEGNGDDSIDLLQQLLQQSPVLSLLVTSRIQLNLRQEHIFNLAPLAYPTQTDRPDAWTFASVQLFIQVAQRVWHEFEAQKELGSVAHICQIVEGVPLAVELAAALVQSQSCAAIAAALSAGFDTLAVRWRDLPARQRSLRATFDYSLSLLPAAAQQLLGKLAAFHDGFTFAAAQVVANATPDLLATLVAHSLVRRDLSGAPAKLSGQIGEFAGAPDRSGLTQLRNSNADDRYLLHETVRQFALASLSQEREQEQTVLRLHSDWFLAQIAQHEAALRRGDLQDGQHWFASESGNWQAAWRWAAEQGNVSQLDQALSGMVRYFTRCGPFAVGLQLLAAASQSLLASDRQVAPTESLTRLRAIDAQGAQEETNAQKLLTRLFAKQAMMQAKLGQFAPAIAAAQQTIVLAQALSDKGLEADAQQTLSMAFAVQGDSTQAEEAATLGVQLATLSNNPNDLSSAQRTLGELNRMRGNGMAAIPLFTAALANAQAEADLDHFLDCKHQLGLAYLDVNQLSAARPLLDECCQLAKRIGDRDLETSALINLGIIHDFYGEYDQSRVNYQLAQQLAEATGNYEHLYSALTNMGLAAQLVGDFATARQQYQQVLQGLRATPGHYQEGLLLANLALLAHQTGDQAAAKQYSLETIRLAESSGSLFLKSYGLTFLAHAFTELGDFGAAITHYQEAAKIRAEMGAENMQIESHAGYVRVLLAQKKVKNALQQSEEILRYLAEHPEAEGTDEPLRIYLTVYQVLKANHDPRAGDLLARAQQLLQTRANRLDDVAQRQSFLHNIKVHHTLLMA